MNEESLFHEALIRPAEERAAFLDQACAGQPELRAEVEALLAAAEQSGHLLDEPPVQTVDFGSGVSHSEPMLERTAEPVDASALATATADFDSTSKARIVIAGRYQLQQKLGEGGMGEVWVAKQTEPVKRRVALKLIKTGMDSRAVIQRFEQERQALAVMDHPNIARVLDGGLTPTGQPFFVMELVNGLPLSRFCDEAKLTPRERLELFVPICQALQHAHQKGIVHRDLKPANILVTLIDGKPVPKVIDFGVAKAVAGKLTDLSISTQFGAVVGTFAYMSPEQAGFAGEDIDTRADIYSLGVILYELLTGLRPIDAKRLERVALTEMIRIIREEDPAKPSTRLSTEESLPSLAALRQIEPRRLMAILKGELDWIVMKCLEKSRERRYETASGLARDIQRYLADEPVEARPPSASYRLGKLLKRYKRAVVATGLVALALIAGIVGTSLGLIDARRARASEEKQRIEAVAERDKAIAAESKAKAINEFLTQDLLLQAEPANNAFEDHVSLLHVLDRAADKVGRRFYSQPELEAALRATIAQTYHGLASWEKAEAQWRSLLDNARERAADSVEFYRALGELAHVLRHRGRVDAKTIGMAEAAASGLARTLGTDHPDTLSKLDALALAYVAAGKLSEAIDLLERVRDTRIAKLGSDHPGTLATLNNLGLAYEAAGKLPDAIRLFEHVRDAEKANLGPDHPSTLTTLNNLAMAYQAAGKLPEAITLLERVRDVEIKKLGPDHSYTLVTLANLASAYGAIGNVPEAIALYERVRDAQIGTLGPDHPDTLLILNNLGGAYIKAGKLSEAIALLERVRNAQIAKLGADHLHTLYTLSNLATAYWSAKQLDNSVALFEDVLRRHEAMLGRQHPSTQLTVASLGVNYKDAGRLDEAIPLLEEAYRASSKFPSICYIGAQLLDAYVRAGHSAAAAKLAPDTVVDAREIWPKESPQLASALMQLALTLLQLKDYGQAESLLRECLATREKTQPDHWNTFNSKSLLGGALLDQRKYADAEPMLVSGFDGMKQRELKIPPEGKDRLTKALERLVQLYEATGRQEEVAKWRKQLEARKAAQSPKDAGRP